MEPNRLRHFHSIIRIIGPLAGSDDFPISHLQRLLPFDDEEMFHENIIWETAHDGILLRPVNVAFTYHNSRCFVLDQ